MRAYAGRCKCGQVVGVIALNDRHREDIADTLAEWVRDGLTIEQMSVSEAREAFGTCRCNESPHQAPLPRGEIREGGDA